MSKRNVNINGRFQVASSDLAALLPNLETCNQKISLSKRVSCNRYNLKGVPAKKCDVLIDPSVIGQDGSNVVLEVCDKAGRFDGAWRIRLTFRRPLADFGDLPKARLCLLITPSESSFTVEAVSYTATQALEAEVYATRTFQRLRTDMLDYDLTRLVRWHWRKFFTHLSEDDIKDVTVSIPDTCTLTEANRLVSGELYRVSTALGWRKLTLREKTRLNVPLDAPSWQRPEVIERIYQGKRVENQGSKENA